MYDGIGKSAADPVRSAFPELNEVGEKSEAAEKSRQREESTPQSEVESKLDEMVERVKATDPVRRDRVHQVTEKIKNGELLSRHAIETTAQKIAEEGT